MKNEDQRLCYRCWCSLQPPSSGIEHALGGLHEFPGGGVKPGHAHLSRMSRKVTAGTAGPVTYLKGSRHMLKAHVPADAQLGLEGDFTEILLSAGSTFRSTEFQRFIEKYLLPSRIRPLDTSLKGLFLPLKNAYHILVIQGLNIFRETQKWWEKHSFFVIVGKCWSRVDVFDVLGIEVKGCSQISRLSPLSSRPRVCSFVPSLLMFCSVILSPHRWSSYQEPQTTVIHNPAEATKVHRSCS